MWYNILNNNYRQKNLFHPADLHHQIELETFVNILKAK